MKAEDGATNRTILFVNWAHALDHFVLLIFPTAVIAIAAELKRDYGDLIWLSTGAFVAFGLFALPIGWLADRFGRRALLTAFFFGYGAACLLVAVSTSFPMLAIALFLLGVFSAIYHPIGSAMIVANARQLGRALGVKWCVGEYGRGACLIDERLGLPVPLAAIGWLTTSIFFCGALTQIAVGRLIDRFELPVIFVGLALLQFSGLVIAAATVGLPMAVGLTLVTAAIYGQVVVNDAMIGRYVPDEFRNRIYSVRFFIGFTVGGMAVPIIGALHRVGGFGEVLMAAAAIAAVIFACALATWLLSRGRTQLAAAPAE
jgi:MFS family permease